MNEIKKLTKAMKKKATYVPSNDDPTKELRRLVQEHVALTKASVALTSTASEKTRRSDLVNADTGEVIAKKGDAIPCRLPVDTQEAIRAFAEEKLKKAAKAIESAMTKELRKVPLFKLFLSKVQGCGPVTAAYLVSMVDFDKCTKPSALKRYCGLAVFDGHREQRTKGQKLGFNQELKTRLWQMFSLGVRMAGSKSAVASKYMTIWNEKKHTLVTMRGPGTADNKAQGWCDNTARRKATDVFVEDLYIVGRALAGLPVWPSWYAKAMGYEHGGKVAVLVPKMLTVEEAMSVVGVTDANESADNTQIAGE